MSEYQAMLDSETLPPVKWIGFWWHWTINLPEQSDRQLLLDALQDINVQLR
jgi:hypothetical protein